VSGVVSAILEHVATLELEPRKRRWTSLSYGVLDAVWSIGSNYDAVVVPLVRGFAASLGDETPVVHPPVESADPLALIGNLSEQLSGPGRNVTPWMVDHAIWTAERGRLRRR
jgi:hypothetical protein